MGVESELDLMGLFQGVGLPFQSESISGQMPNMVFLYRVPMLLYWAEHDETLGSIVTHVLVHEIGHHFGLSDEDMAAIEAGVSSERKGGRRCMKIDGSCACGTITVEGEADPADVSICHCTDCQTGTGSAFRVSVLGARRPSFKMTGTPKDYLKLTADSGTPRIQAFCPELRLADLFDLAGRRRAGRLPRARRHPAPAQGIRAEEAELVPLGAAVDHRACPRSPKNEEQG